MLYALLTVFAAAVVALDQWTKAWAAAQLADRVEVLIPGWLELRYMRNDGMALSMLSGARWLFVAIAILFIGLVVWAIAKKHITKKPELWMIAAIVGGAIGNLIDRVATGQVIDMICVPWFSTFNVADIFITVPAVLLVVYILIWDKDFLSDKPRQGERNDHSA